MATEVIPPVPLTETADSLPAEDPARLNESPEPDASSIPAVHTSKNGAEGVENGESSSPRSSRAVANGSAAASSESKEEVNGKAATIKPKKKEDKSIEYILRALSSLSTPEEKLAALCKKYADLHEEHRVLQSSFKQQQRRMTVVTREKDQLQAEHTKAVIAKSKLESLCRELQKHNKLIKEESLQRVKDEDERRKEISAKFQVTIGEIQQQMSENHDKNVKLREENADLTGKLKKFIDQYEIREQQLEKLMKHRELEQQLNEAKLQKAAAILKEEQERNLKEKEILVLQATEGVKKSTVLEAQLTMYKDRYEEFQATINKSNDMFQKLKAEMDKMGKRIKKLEKEGAQWRAKWETSNKALLDMAEEKTHTDKEKQMLQTKIQRLESLCRALQGELHGKKSASPLPLPTEAEVPVEITRENTLVTTTPPNTPENTSRASPDSTCGPPALGSMPAKQNGPIVAPPLEMGADVSPSTQPSVSSEQDMLVSSSGAAVESENSEGEAQSEVTPPCDDVSQDTPPCGGVSEVGAVSSTSESSQATESISEASLSNEGQAEVDTAASSTDAAV